MSRIDDIFASLRAQNAKALMPFICGSHPRPGDTARLLPALQAAGAHIVEIGIPFSDPIADGPIIASAMHDAIQNGANPASLFAEVASVRDQLSIGLVAMISMSIIHRLGDPATFVSKVKAAGFDGLIVPDAPLEEASALRAAAIAADLSFSFLISPNTPPQRLETIAKACSGFVYVLARVGITGESSAPLQIGPLVESVRQATSLPIAVGFGVSTPQQVETVTSVADAAIVGSALVRCISQSASQGGDFVQAASEFVSNLSQGLARKSS